MRKKGRPRYVKATYNLDKFQLHYEKVAEGWRGFHYSLQNQPSRMVLFIRKFRKSLRTHSPARR